MQLFHQNYVYGSACISNLRQGTNYGLRMRLKRTDCSCTGLGNVVAELESRYMLMYGPLSESSIPVGNMQAGLRWRWPQSGVITLDYSDFLVT
ncbi:MAG: hypothetical protein NT001_00230, partial [Candidatus Woesearchaeota archaeon]|nr:hypothetical protein [Candidatus Woesearchaeota archaeon]